MNEDEWQKFLEELIFSNQKQSNPNIFVNVVNDQNIYLKEENTSNEEYSIENLN